MKFIDDAKLKAAVWWRERKDKAEERKAAHAEPPGVTIPLSLVRSAKLAAWMAYFSLVYFLWLYTLDIARDRAASLHLTHVGAWIGEIQFYFPYIVGFAIVAIGIPYVAKIAIPTFMSLSWRGNFWPKLWALFIAVAVSLVVIAGTFTVQGDTILERDRDAAVAVENVQQGRAALEAQIESRRQELADMMNNSNAYLAQAASVGAAEWERSYIAQARATNDPRLPMIERALGAARSADTARAEINTLRQQLAQSQTVASVQETVTTERTGWIADTLGWLEGARAMLLSFVMDIVCLIMPWIALRLEQARNRQVGMAEGIAPHPWMIQDLRNATGEDGKSPMSAAAFKEATLPMDPHYKGDVIYNEKGEEMKWVAGHVRDRDRKFIPGHYRPTGKRQKREIEVDVGGKVFTATGVEDDGPAYNDGGNRIARTVAGPIDLDNPGVAPSAFEQEVSVQPSEDDRAGDKKAQNSQNGEHGRDDQPIDDNKQQGVRDNYENGSLQSSDLVQDVPPAEELTDDLASFLEEPETQVEADQQSEQPREEPETDERRMIAAE